MYINDVIGNIRSWILKHENELAQLRARVQLLERITDAPDFQEKLPCQLELPLRPEED